MVIPICTNYNFSRCSIKTPNLKDELVEKGENIRQEAVIKKITKTHYTLTKKVPSFQQSIKADNNPFKNLRAGSYINQIFFSYSSLFLQFWHCKSLMNLTKLQPNTNYNYDQGWVAFLQVNIWFLFQWISSLRKYKLWWLHFNSEFFSPPPNHLLILIQGSIRGPCRLP